MGSKSNYYIFQEFKNKKGTFSFKNEKFWLNWLSAEKKENDDPKISLEENYFRHLLSLSKIMNLFNLECKFILNLLVDKFAKEFIKSVKNF
jgi:hypothetical protein